VELYWIKIRKGKGKEAKDVHKGGEGKEEEGTGETIHWNKMYTADPLVSMQEPVKYGEIMV